MNQKYCIKCGELHVGNTSGSESLLETSKIRLQSGAVQVWLALLILEAQIGLDVPRLCVLPRW